MDSPELLKELSGKYGPPGHRNSKGELNRINERFFAELIALENRWSSQSSGTMQRGRQQPSAEEFEGTSET
jgi:hypothetical protein